MEKLSNQYSGSSDLEGGIYWLRNGQTAFPEYSGVTGALFVDQTDTSKRLFFPASGYCFDTTCTHNGDVQCCYWSSELYTKSDAAYRMFIYGGTVKNPNDQPSASRCLGFSIRPVLDIE